jgi:hypothetical protein
MSYVQFLSHAHTRSTIGWIGFYLPFTKINLCIPFSCALCHKCCKANALKIFSRSLSLLQETNIQIHIGIGCVYVLNSLNIIHPITFTWNEGKKSSTSFFLLLPFHHPIFSEFPSNKSILSSAHSLTLHLSINLFIFLFFSPSFPLSTSHPFPFFSPPHLI